MSSAPRRPWVKWAAIAGIVAPLLFAILVPVIGLLTPGYSQFSQTVSELGQVGQPYAILQDVNFVLTGLLVIGLVVGFAMTPLTAFGFWGTLDALLVMLVYAFVCIASILFFWRKRRERFNILLHGVSPVIGTIIIGIVFVFLLLAPAPPPLNAIPFVLAAWVLIGVVVLFVFRRRLTQISE